MTYYNELCIFSAVTDFLNPNKQKISYKNELKYQFDELRKARSWNIFVAGICNGKKRVSYIKLLACFLRKYSTDTDGH